MEYLFAVYSVFSFSNSEVDILLQTQCLPLNFDAKIYISAIDATTVLIYINV